MKYFYLLFGLLMTFTAQADNTTIGWRCNNGGEPHVFTSTRSSCSKQCLKACEFICVLVGAEDRRNYNCKKIEKSGKVPF